MKVVLISSLYPPNIVGGAERVVQRLAGALSSRKHEVVVISTQPQGEALTATHNGVKAYYLPVRNLYRPFGSHAPNAAQKALWHFVDSYNPMMARQITDIVRNENPDVVNTHNLTGFSVAAWSAVKQHGVPLVHTLHDHYLLCYRTTMFRDDTVCVRRCADCYAYAAPRQQAARKVDVVVGVSRYLLQQHTQRDYFSGAEQKVIYNSLDRSPPDAARSAGNRGPLIRFGFLGQIRPNKGLHLLIEAFQQECSADAELWIAGRGDASYEARLRERTRASNQVRWLGFVDPSQLLDAIDVLVVPSLWQEPAGLVIPEAFSHSVPVLASNRGGIPELVAAETGWIFDAGSIHSLRTALRHCIESRQRLPAMGAAARQAATRFDLATFADQYEAALADAISRGRTRPSNITAP